MTISAVVVAIPARDEAQRIGAALLAVARAAESCPLPVVVAVACDSCSDDTPDIARRVLASVAGSVDGVVVPCESGNAATARELAVRVGVDRAGSSLDRTWIATTDADSRVPSSWLDRQLGWASIGADGVAGLVRLDRRTPAILRHQARRLQVRRGSRFGHPHVYGANLGFTARGWHDVGGFPSVRVGEDHALWRALRDRGARLVAVNDIVVTTSGRTTGRAVDGFASVLAGLV